MTEQLRAYPQFEAPKSFSCDDRGLPERIRFKFPFEPNMTGETTPGERAYLDRLGGALWMECGPDLLGRNPFSIEFGDIVFSSPETGNMAERDLPLIKAAFVKAFNRVK